MIRAVVDTNLVVSAILSPGGKPAEVLRAAGVRFDLVWSPAIALECRRVLASPKIARALRGRAADALALVDRLAALAVTMVDPDLLPAVRVVPRDPDDDVLFATALAGGARLVVSGDARVLAVGSFGGVATASAVEFLAILGRP